MAKIVDDVGDGLHVGVHDSARPAVESRVVDSHEIDQAIVGVALKMIDKD